MAVAACAAGPVTYAPRAGYPPVPIAFRSEGPICLALSGGGMRAASHSMGVMAALADAGWLERVEAISGVSGGSWAMSWYVAQAHANRSSDRGELLTELFHENGPFQMHVERRARLFPPWLLAGGVAVHLFFSALTLPFRVAARLLDLPELAPNPQDLLLQRAYEESLVETFLTPIVAIEGELVRAPTSAPGDAERLLGDRDPVPSLDELSVGVPEVTFNMTMVPKDGRVRFEVGSRGRWGVAQPARHDPRWEKQLELNYSLAVSSAAADMRGLGLGRLELLELLFGSAMGRDWESVGSTVYLTDGGHLENLGLPALVDRGCERIVVVDSGYDPDGVLEDLSDVENFLPAGMSLNLRRPTEPMHSSSNPVFMAEICRAEQLVAEAIVVKLWRDDDVRYPASVEEWATSCGRCVFPQVSTFDQNFSVEQFRAYRDLGRENLRRAISESGTLSTPERTCSTGDGKPRLSR